MAAIDVTDQTFQSEVIEASRSRPIVVDFWAPWCGPCRALSPIIERVAAEHGNDVRLVKINTDENPSISQSFRIQGIPAVKAFRDGKVVAEFVGAQGEQQVRAFFQRLVPSQADRLAAKGAAAFKTGNLAAARQAFEEALGVEAAHPRSIGGLAAVFMDEGNLDAAEELLQRALGSPYVKRQLARLRLERGAQGADEGTLLARLAQNEDDVEAQYRLGCILALRRKWNEALEHFLAVVRRDRGYGDDAGRLAALGAFDLLGEEHAATREYRGRLASLLF